MNRFEMPVNSSSFSQNWWPCNLSLFENLLPVFVNYQTCQNIKQGTDYYSQSRLVKKPKDSGDWGFN